MTLPGFDHYDYDELDDPARPCGCCLCQNVRVLAEKRRAARADREGQAFVADTDESIEWRRAMREHLAASNKRDLFSECCFLFRQERWRDEFLTWLLGRIQDSTWRTPYWWVREAEIKSLGSWVEDWFEAATGQRRGLARLLKAAD